MEHLNGEYAGIEQVLCTTERPIHSLFTSRIAIPTPVLGLAVLSQFRLMPAEIPQRLCLKTVAFAECVSPISLGYGVVWWQISLLKIPFE